MKTEWKVTAWAMGVLALLAATASAGDRQAFASDRGRVGGGPSWSDEFTGSAGLAPDPRLWKHDLGATGWGNGELQRYTASRRNAHLDGRGRLVIVARHRKGSGRERGSYTSARLTTDGTFSFLYGRVAMRARLPRGQGLWPAFWMLGSRFPELDWPFCGEIDVMEYLGHRPRVSYGFVHGPGSLSDVGVGGSNRSAGPLSAGFHVYSALWRRDRISFSVDGRIFETVRRSSYPAGQTWAFDQRMFLLLNLAVGGEWPGRPDAETGFPARMSVDWVRVWERTP